jgi:precorrin-8X/cobalt-precorrin-8 methylmutase
MPNDVNDYVRDPAEIYRRSVEAIRREIDLSRFSGAMAEVALRLVHACAMPDIVGDIVFSPGAAESGRGALESGAAIFVDGEMTGHGIIRSRLPRKNAVICTLGDSKVPVIAKRNASTRASAAVDLWRGKLQGAVIAIGTAPTALFRLLEVLAESGERPAVILGFPVGFVGAAESKEALANQTAVPFIALWGRRGGAALAAAAVNALAAPLIADEAP